MNVFWKFAYRSTPELTGYDYLFVRSPLMIIFAYTQARLSNVNVFNIKEGYRMKIYWFGLSGVVGVPWFYVGLKYIPASIATLIHNVHPIVVAVIAPLFLDESITFIKIFSVIGSFIGTSLFIIHKNVSSGDADNYYFGILLVWITVTTGTMMAIIMRLVNTHVHYTLCPFYLGIAVFLTIIWILIIFPEFFHFSSFNFLNLTYFICASIFGFFGVQ